MTYGCTGRTWQCKHYRKPAQKKQQKRQSQHRGYTGATEECKHSRKTGIAGYRKKKRQQQKWQCWTRMAMWNGHDEEDTETHGAIHTREAYEKLSIVYEKVREGCHYDISCVRRYHFIRDVFIPIHLKLHNSSRRQSTHCGNPS